MQDNYLIVLFKNKKRKKIIKRYTKEKIAIDNFNSLIRKNDFSFSKIIENATSVKFELALLSKSTSFQSSLFITDEMGRNNLANLEDSEYVFLDIKTYQMEEKIFDWQTKKKITFNELLLKYCKSSNLKNIFTLNNKLCIQIDENVSTFSLKNKDESVRLLETIEDYFVNQNRSDGIFVKDMSTAQRKWLYKILEEKGFSKKTLYRIKTTFSRR